MNKKSFRLLTLLTTLLLLVSCSPKTESQSPVSEKGVAPVLIGSQVSELPDRVEGLYDSFEVIHFEDTETGFLPSRIYAQFKRDGKVCFEADLDESGEQRICSVHVFDPTITYKGLGAGTPIAEILKTEARLYLTGNYSSCFFDAYFQLDNICFAFDFFNGKSFSRTGKARIINREFSEPTLFPLSAPDFQHDAVISKICIYPL